jgi:hypothetical protein
MRQISAREKVFLGIGVVAALVILVYFFIFPMLQGNQSESAFSKDELEQKLAATERLEDMQPLLVSLEERMRDQSGYKNLSFKRGIADSVIIRFIAQKASDAGIGELEQLDAKAETRRRSQTSQLADQVVLRAVADQIYLTQVMHEAKQIQTDKEDEDKEVDESGMMGGFDPSQIPSEALEFIKEQGFSIEELMGNSELREELKQQFETKMKQQEKGNTDEDGNPENDEGESELADEQNNKDAPAATDESAENGSNVKQEKLFFPPIPVDIPDDVKNSLAKWIENHNGKALMSADIDGIMSEVEMQDENERSRIKKRLQLYSDRVKQVKNDLSKWLSELNVLRDAKSSQKTEEFSVKMVFKSQMDQLVRLLYDLQNTAKWIDINSVRISISDRRQTVLSVDLGMTATVLYN